MGKENDVLKTLQEKSVSRRSFMKGAVALGAMASVYGCSKDSGSDIIYGGGTVTVDGITSDDLYYTETPTYRYGTSAHNCGGRCIIKAQVTPDRRIVRFLTDESDYTGNGVESTSKPIDVQHRNAPQFRACARCRAYKGRLYHPGRLKYPLKQTKKRGDVTGFERISWSQALREIAQRKNAIQNKYGNETVHAIYACGNIYSVYQSASYGGVFASNDQVSPALRLLGGATGYTSDYSFHQVSYAGGWYGLAWNGFNTGNDISINPTADTVALHNTDVVLWGSNTPTTHNPVAYSWVKSMEEMRARGGKVWFIGPEFSEIGIAQADEWIQIKPYTDTALVLGMLHYMITKTVDTDGTIHKGQGYLDLDYIDTMVYGFFDSPEYYLNTTDGTISLTNPSDGSIKIEKVPDGKSLSAYILGSTDDRLVQAKYGNSNYTATQFGAATPRNKAVCSYTSASATPSFAYKSHFAEAKDPEWASKITGVPADKIIELAEVYLNSDRRIWNEWAGGLQKQAEGVTGIMAIQTLCILTKVWGYKGGGFMNQAITPSRTANANQLTDAEIQANVKWGEVAAMRAHPQPSVAQWHNAIKAAFGDELYTNGYRPDNIADWDYEEGGEKRTAKGHAYLDDGGVKALVNRNESYRLGSLQTYTGDDGGTYYDYDGRTSGTGATYAGFRFILNTGGNIPVNQHPNCSDLAKMYEYLPSFGHANGFNVESEADSFCLVTFDNFMSPSARYSDYVLPAKTTWEQEDFKYLDQSNNTNLYIDDVIPGPGESKSTWDFARDFIAACDGDVAKFTGGDATTTFKDVVMKAFATKSAAGVGPYAGKTWEEFLEKPFITPEYNTTYEQFTKSALRTNLESYLGGNKQAAFVKEAAGYYVDCATAGNHYGFGSDGYSKPDECYKTAYRFMVYMPQLVWCYENAYSKWHGHLPKEERGQKNIDIDGDPIVYPIIMYYDYQDYFAEAYGVDRSELTRENGYFLLTTTHDRFRAHSSQAENPFLRELTHRTKGGALYSGNDSGAYAVSNGLNAEGYETFPALNTLIGEDGQPVAGAENRASYADIWVNDEDFKDYKDGDLVKVYNNVGAVYCTIRKTARCVPGYVGLHQGCWYDPRTINGQTVDVGGNCNTIMASRPSRYDHGNAAQSAMVKIEPVR